jgi:hypothetical protein
VAVGGWSFKLSNSGFVPGTVGFSGSPRPVAGEEKAAGPISGLFILSLSPSPALSN